MSVWSMGGGDRLSMGDVPPLPEWAAEARGLGTFGALGGLGGGLGAKDKAEGDARWISEFSDGLTVAIALREWEEAVGLVEEGKWRCFLLFLGLFEISGCDADGIVQVNGTYRPNLHSVIDLRT